MLVSRAVFRSRLRPNVRLPHVKHLHDFHNHPQSKFLKVSEEVRDAVATGKPVVALETTIYTHGELDISLGRRNALRIALLELGLILSQGSRIRTT